MDKSKEKKCYRRIAENFEEQMQLLETLCHIQELTMNGIAADEGGEMPKEQMCNITCMFAVMRVMIKNREFGFYIPETE